MQILPLENTRGRDLVEAGKLCERKNGRGVDTNRNWEVDWGKKEKDYDPAEEYPGTAPFRWVRAQTIHRTCTKSAAAGYTAAGHLKHCVGACLHGSWRGSRLCAGGKHGSSVHHSTEHASQNVSMVGLCARVA